jgi:hypothetical protein
MKDHFTPIAASSDVAVLTSRLPAPFGLVATMGVSGPTQSGGRWHRLRFLARR